MYFGFGVGYASECLTDVWYADTDQISGVLLTTEPYHVVFHVACFVDTPTSSSVILHQQFLNPSLNQPVDSQWVLFCFLPSGTGFQKWAPLHLTYCNVSLVFNNSHLVAWTVSLYIQNFDLKTRMWLLSTSYLTLYVTVDLRGIFSAREYIYVMHTAYNNGRGCTLNKKQTNKHGGDWVRGGGV